MYKRQVLLRGVQARHIEDPARRPEVRRNADDTQRGDEIDIPVALRRKILRLDTPGRQPLQAAEQAKTIAMAQGQQADNLAWAKKNLKNSTIV